MRSSPFFFVVVYLALVFEGVVRFLPHPEIKLDIVWLAVLFLGFFVPLLPGGIMVLVLALFQEAAGSPFHGLLLPIYLCIYLFLRLAHRHLFFQRRTSQVIWVVLLSLAYRGAESGFLVWQGYEGAGDGLRFLAWTLLEGVASLAVFPLLKVGGKIGHSFRA